VLESPRDRAATIFLECRDKLRRFLIARLRNIEDAEDVLQEAFIHLQRSLPENQILNPEAYLFKVAANLAIDRMRQEISRRTREKDWLEAHTQSGSDGYAEPVQERQTLAKLDLERIATLLNELSPQVRRAFILHKLKGLSHREVSMEMGIAKSTVEKHIIKAVGYLLERMN